MRAVVSTDCDLKPRGHQRLHQVERRAQRFPAIFRAAIPIRIVDEVGHADTMGRVASPNGLAERESFGGGACDRSTGRARTITRSEAFLEWSLFLRPSALGPGAFFWDQPKQLRMADWARP